MLDELTNPGKKIDLIEAKNIYHHVFWSNLSFCNSQKTHLRKIGGVTLEAKIEDEVVACLEENYLKELINIIQPLTTVVFSRRIEHKISPKDIVKNVFQGVVDFSESNYHTSELTPYERKDGVKVKITIGLYRQRQHHIFFLPHPEYKVRQDRLRLALEALVGEK